MTDHEALARWVEKLEARIQVIEGQFKGIDSQGQQGREIIRALRQESRDQEARGR